jgi:hypothetical protein
MANKSVNIANASNSEYLASFFAGFIMCCAIVSCGNVLGFISIFPKTTVEQMEQTCSQPAAHSNNIDNSFIINKADDVSAAAAAAVDDDDHDEKQQQGQWRWSPSGSCKKGTEAYNHLRIKPSKDEYMKRKLSEEHLKQALETFRACGVVAIEPGFSNHVDMVSRLEKGLNGILSPLLDSRRRIRSKLRHAMQTHSSLRSLWKEPNVTNELLFEQ